LPFAVIPLDPNNIKLSFEKASLPLSDEVLQEGAQWYQSFDPSERAALGSLLEDKIEAVRAVTRNRPPGSTDSEISRLEEPLDLTDFVPCMKNIIEKAEDREGRHRVLAVLATYLYQMGWPEDRAFDLWLEVADRCGVESRIFETTFGLVSCPLCSTMLQDTGGYPHLNLHGMGFVCLMIIVRVASGPETTTRRRSLMRTSPGRKMRRANPEMGLCGGHSSVFFPQLGYCAL
jgi:hypothetical protein